VALGTGLRFEAVPVNQGTDLRKNTVKQRLLAGETVVNGWLAIGSSYSAEIAGMAGFDAVTVDLQHGMIGFDAALGMFQALSATPAVPLARVPANDGPQIMRLLDAGAYGIICPMISTPDDAARFVSACRYPPQGDRSCGPARGLLYGGADYLQHANEEMLRIGMIETQAGLDNLDKILEVEGLDGIYIGPNDLSFALGQAPSSEPTAPVVVDAIAHILERTLAHKKIPGIFCSSGQAAAMRIAQGFKIVTPGNEAALLAQALKLSVADARSTSAKLKGTSTGY
jgi:4-hydroxy-2-oxoheptanedioate aldolase